MIIKMCRKDDPVLLIDMECCISTPYIKDLKIINKELLPFLREAEELSEVEASFSDAVDLCLRKWFRKRCVSDGRVNLDAFLLSLYSLPQYQFGRMRGFQHLAAMLSYYASGEDDYYITPSFPTPVSLALQDPRIHDIYMFLPADFSVIKEMKENPDPELRKFLLTDYPIPPINNEYKFTGFFKTVDFTINTKEKAIWDEEKKKIIYL